MDSNWECQALRQPAVIHTKVLRGVRPGCLVDFNDIGLSCVSQSAGFLDNIDTEALPTSAGWGCFYAPMPIRYQRNFGIPAYGMTGRCILVIHLYQ